MSLLLCYINQRKFNSASTYLKNNAIDILSLLFVLRECYKTILQI